MKSGWTIAIALLATGASATAWVVESEPWGRLARGWAVLTGGGPSSSYDTPSNGAAAGACSSMHPGASAPILPKRMTRRAVVRCRTSFTLLHSAATRTPLWVSERLTPEGVADAARMERVDAFEPDPSLPKKDRAELKDYRRSRWDRGHMAPNGDMPDAKSQAESFELSNITPQAPDLNRGSWSELESDVRRHVRRTGMAYVVTGVLYEGPAKTLNGGRVVVPTSIWKAILTPNRGSVVMVAMNAKGGRPLPTSVESFRIRTGIDPFPAITAGDRAKLLVLDSESAR